MAARHERRSTLAEPRRTTCGDPVPETDGKVCFRLPAHKGEHRLTLTLTRSSANKAAHRSSAKAKKPAGKKTGPRLPLAPAEPVTSQVTKPARAAAMQTPNREAKARATATG